MASFNLAIHDQSSSSHISILPFWWNFFKNHKQTKQYDLEKE